MNKRVLNYINKLDESNYTFLDNVLVSYVRGSLQNLLLDNGATDIEFYPSIKKNDKSIQIYFNYCNMSAVLEFNEEWYEHCKYTPGCSAEEIENSIIRVKYGDDFIIDEFINEFIKSINDDSRLIKAKRTYSKSKNKKKTYEIISIVSLCIPLLVFGILGAYSIIADKALQLTPWFLLVIIIPLIVWSVFDSKSKRNK